MCTPAKKNWGYKLAQQFSDQIISGRRQPRL